jgi:hypothetical protein
MSHHGAADILVLLLCLSVVCAGGGSASLPRDIVTTRGSWQASPSFVPLCFVRWRLACIGPQGQRHTMVQLASWPFFCTCLFCAQEAGPFQSSGTMSHHGAAGILALLLYLSVLCAGGWPFWVPRDNFTPQRAGILALLLYLSVLCAGGGPFPIPRNHVTPGGGWHPVLLLYLSVLCAGGGSFSVPRDHVTPRGGWHSGPSFVPVCFVHRRLALFGP